MNLKKIWLFLLLFTISFSAGHEYAFVALNENCYTANNSSVAELNKVTNILHEVHVEYHTAFTFTEKSIYIPITKKKNDFFKYNKVFLSFDYFNFFKPPIA